MKIIVRRHEREKRVAVFRREDMKNHRQDELINARVGPNQILNHVLDLVAVILQKVNDNGDIIENTAGDKGDQTR